MRTMLRSKVTLLFMTFAVLLAFPAVALADQFVDQLASNADKVTITSGDATGYTNNYWVDAAGSCDVSAEEPGKFSLNVPVGVTASATTLTFTACGEGAKQAVKFTSSTSGSYTITADAVDNGTTGDTTPVDSTPQATFTLIVQDYCPSGDLSDADGDGIGGNSVADRTDGTCSASTPPPPSDTDGDGVADSSDNCPNVANANQTDTDIDGAGDACDTPAHPTLSLATASDSGSLNTDKITNDDTPTFEGTAQAGHTVKVYDGSGATDVLLGTVTAEASGNWSFTVGDANSASGVTELSDGTYTIKATASNSALTSSATSLANVLIDTVDPAVTYDNSGTPATNLNYSLSGWFNGSQVPVSSPLFTASDGGSGIDFAGSVLAANTYTFTLSVSAESTKVNNVVVPTSTSKTILDVAGNDTVQNFSAQIDKTNPSLGIVDGNAASYNLCDSARPVEPTTNPTDALSDILANSLTTSWVNNTAPSGLGSYSYSASVKDNALNTDSYSKTYTVVAGSAYRGVQQPVNLTGSRSAFKLGSAVPVKFQLTCDTAPISNSVAKLYLAKQDSVASAVNEPTATNSPDIGNQFRVTDTATGQYQFNLSTKAGSQFMGPSGNTVTLGEGTWFMYISLDGGAKFKAAEFDIKK